MIAQSVTVVKV